MITDTILLNVDLDATTGHLLFAFRQCVLLRATAQRILANGELSAQTITLEVDGPAALRVPAETAPGIGLEQDAYTLKIEYQGLPPVLVGSNPSLPDKEDRESPANARLRLIKSNFAPDSCEYTRAVRWQALDEATDAVATGPIAEGLRFRLFLLNRTARRRAMDQAGKRMESDSSCPEAIETITRSIEPKLRAALDELSKPGEDLQSCGGQHGLAELAKSFASFTAGDLGFRTLQGDDQRYRFFGVPDGAMHLCFAEAALWFACKVPDERDYWLARAKIFTAVMPQFLAHYLTANGSPRTRYAYDRGVLTTPIPLATLEQAIARNQHCSEADLNDQLTTSARDAFADEGQSIYVSDQASVRIAEVQMLKESPDQGRDFDPDKGPFALALQRAIKRRAALNAVPYSDDPVEQLRNLEAHIKSRLLNEKLEVTYRPEGADADKTVAVGVDRCRGKHSTYNCKTGTCDPDGSRASYQWRITSWPNDSCSQPGIPEAKTAFMTATPIIQKPGSAGRCPRCDD